MSSSKPNQELENSKIELSDDRICRRQFFAYAKAQHDTIDWGEAPEHTNDIIAVQAVEEGAFKVTVPRAGHYALVVVGRAGMNKAVWLVNDVEVRPGVEVTLKMSSPEKACLDVEE